MRQRANDCQSISLQAKPIDSIGVKPPVAKLVKSFGGLRNAAESLDDFRYARPSQREGG